MADETPLILIVDDERNTARTMAMALEAVGYHTAEAGSASEGLALAYSLHPGLILMDYHMGDMDGVTALRELRQDAWGKHASVIIASNVYDVDIINAIMELGVQDYVLKVDINLNELIGLVGKYLPPGIPENH